MFLKSLRGNFLKKCKFIDLTLSILPTAENRCRHCKHSLQVMMFWMGLGWNKQTKSFTIVHKCFIYIYVQFLLTKHACDERLCNSVPCISENWWHRDMFRSLACESQSIFWVPTYIVSRSVGMHRLTSLFCKETTETAMTIHQP